MAKKEKEILSGFLADENTSTEDLKRLKKWLEESDEPHVVLFDEWNKNDSKETDLSFSSVQKGIVKLNSQEPDLLKRIVTNFQKAAAIIIFPLLVVSLYLFIQQRNTEPVYFETLAERGQKSQLVLPDGTKVWLNSDSKILYPDNFGKRNRSIKLIGEAYFEVKKDAEKPFFIEAEEAGIKVLGTSFNVRAYPEDKEIETTLFEGNIELTINPQNENIAARTLKLKPGESIKFDKTQNVLKYNNQKSDEILAWTNNQLIFRNDNFENLVGKIERWYDVDIVYDKESLDNQRLTVELYQGELLFRLLEIIELAMNVECESKENKIYIKPTEK